jgi:NAD(P)-dependent dehydrogenase (short-subunit alcohol dehydrogenase family)
MLLQDKNAVIYGGGGAIGGAVARAFARQGANVFLVGRTLAKLDRVAREISASGGGAEIAEVDALDENPIDEHADAVARSAGGIDVTLNAVGIVHDQGTPFGELLPPGLRAPDHRLHPDQFPHREGGRTAHGQPRLGGDLHAVHPGLTHVRTGVSRLRRHLRSHRSLLPHPGG